MKNRKWTEGNNVGNHLYFETETGLIIGEVSSVGVQTTRSLAVVYTDPRAPQTIIGQFVNADCAKQAVERYWRIDDSILLEESPL